MAPTFSVISHTVVTDQVMSQRRIVVLRLIKIETPFCIYP